VKSRFIVNSQSTEVRHELLGSIADSARNRIQWLFVDTPRNYRPIAIGAGATLILAIAVAVTTEFARPKTPFEREHAHGEATNPYRVNVELTTADKRHEYREGEVIFFRVHFSSPTQNNYKIDIGEGYSRAASSDQIHISNGEPFRLYPYGIVCCGFRLVGLDDEGYTSSGRAGWRPKPGDYEVYLTSRRVFPLYVTEEYEPSSFEVTSNLLKIRVAPRSR
jgi:hypothetical protein